MIILALYKNKGTNFDKAIRYVTKSKYSHAELIIGGVWFSSSARDGGVRSKLINYNPDSWDFIFIDGVNQNAIIEFFNKINGSKYDYLGVARFILPFLPQSSSRYFCFEVVADMLIAGGFEKGDKPTYKFTAEDLSQWTETNLKRLSTTGLH